MKYLRTLTAFTLSVFVVIFLNIGVFAADNADYPYYIKDYKVSAVLQQNNVVSVTEDITIYYNESRRGFFRVLPVDVKMNVLVDGEKRLMKYKVEYDNVFVNDDYELSNENGFLNIRIGSADRYLTGEKTYRINYTMDIGDDRIDEFDFFYFSAIGTDWDCPIENASFDVTFPKQISKSDVEIYLGEYGSAVQLDVNWKLENNILTASTKRALGVGEGMTLYTMLPEGYFVGERTVSTLGSVVGSIACLALFAAIIFIHFKTKRTRSVVQVIEFNPPEDITSAQVGYVMDGMVSDNEALSLIVWLASKKFITIEDDGQGNVTIIKNADKDEKQIPSHVKPIYNDLFSDDRQSVEVDELNLFEAVQSVKSLAPAYFHGKKKIKNSTYGVVSGILAIITIVIGVSSLIGFGGGIYVGMAISAILTAIISVIMLIYSKIVSLKWNFHSSLTKTIFFVFSVMAVLGGGAVNFVFAQNFSFAGSILPALAGVCMVSASIFSAFTDTFTEYGSRLNGSLMGLKEFIKQAEIPKIEELVKENPNYFFDVLPYAYVFGLTDTWIKTFETISLNNPEIYGAAGGYYYNPYYMYSLTRSLSTVHRQMIPTVDTSSFNSGSGGGFNASGFGGSGSGGGFSGGGFGGGGGRSW